MTANTSVLPAAVNFDRQMLSWCVIQRICIRLGDRVFAVGGPRLCNSLMIKLHQFDFSLGQFCQVLKTFVLLESAAPSDFCL